MNTPKKKLTSPRAQARARGDVTSFISPKQARAGSISPRAQARTRGDAKAFMSPSQAKAFTASQPKPMQLGVGPSQPLAPRARARAAGLATSFMNPSQARAFQKAPRLMGPELINPNIGLNLALQNRQAATLGAMGNVAQRPIANNDGGMGFIGAPMGSKSASNYTRQPMNF